MKTIETIADETAEAYGYESIDKAIRRASTTIVFHIMRDTAEEYAKQCCDEQIKACVLSIVCTEDNLTEFNSVLNTPNVVTTNTK